MSEEETTTSTVCFRITDQKLELIEKLVELGFYKSKSRFFQTATTHKLEQIFQGQEELFHQRLKELEEKIKAFKVLQS